MRLDADRSHARLLGHQGLHDVFRTVQALARRLAGADDSFLENRFLWFLLSDFRRKEGEECFEGSWVKVGRQHVENVGSRGQPSRVGNDPKPESMLPEATQQVLCSRQPTGWGCDPCFPESEKDNANGHGSCSDVIPLTQDCWSIDSDSRKAGLNGRDFFIQGGLWKIPEQGSGAVENCCSAVGELRGSRQPLGQCYVKKRSNLLRCEDQCSIFFAGEDVECRLVVDATVGVHPTVVTLTRVWFHLEIPHVRRLSPQRRVGHVAERFAVGPQSRTKLPFPCAWVRGWLVCNDNSEDVGIGSGRRAR